MITESYNNEIHKIIRAVEVIIIFFRKKIIAELNKRQNRYNELRKKYEYLNRKRDYYIKHGFSVGEINEQINEIKHEMNDVWGFKKDMRNARDEAIKKIKSIKISAKHKKIIGASAVAILAISVIIKIYRSYRKKLEEKRKEQEKEDELKKKKTDMNWED